LILRRLRSDAWRRKQLGVLTCEPFFCVVGNAQGSTRSNAAHLTVHGTLAFFFHPSLPRFSARMQWTPCLTGRLPPSRTESLEEMAYLLQQDYMRAREQAAQLQLPPPPLLVLPTHAPPKSVITALPQG
jgi:hypothetical protein